MGITGHDDPEQRIRYNAMVQRMRKHEYPMIKGVLPTRHLRHEVPD